MSRYIIEFTNGDAPIEVDGYLDVEPTLRAKYGLFAVVNAYEEHTRNRTTFVQTRRTRYPRR